MAKDGDIIDVMFRCMFELLGWIFKTICKITWWIISTVFGVIFQALFGKKKQNKENNSTNNSQTNLYSYRDCLEDIEAAAQNYTGEELNNRYGYLFVNLLINGSISVDEKCRLLENADIKIRTNFSNNPREIGTFYMTYIDVAFKAIDQIFGGDSSLIAEELNEYTNDFKKGDLKPMSHYIAKIMSYAGLIASPNGEFSIDYSILDKYNLPKWYKEI